MKGTKMITGTGCMALLLFLPIMLMVLIDRIMRRIFPKSYVPRI